MFLTYDSNNWRGKKTVSRVSVPSACRHRGASLRWKKRKERPVEKTLKVRRNGRHSHALLYGPACSYAGRIRRDRRRAMSRLSRKRKKQNGDAKNISISAASITVCNNNKCHSLRYCFPVKLRRCLTTPRRFRSSFRCLGIWGFVYFFSFGRRHVVFQKSYII